MIYISSGHIAIKKDQDRVFHDADQIIICDGIGEFQQSDKAAEVTIENIKHGKTRKEIGELIKGSANAIAQKEIIGGTTLIWGKVYPEDQNTFLEIAYLGNGSVFHLPGNFGELPEAYSSSNSLYKYSNILIPHVDKDGRLLRHISHHSGATELKPSFINLSLNGLNGDIILFFSDGVSSLEDDVIIADGQERIWRHQSQHVSFIIEKLHHWLKNNIRQISNESLFMFIKDCLVELSDKKLLEDDASIGIIITEAVIEHYKAKDHAE